MHWTCAFNINLYQLCEREKKISDFSNPRTKTEEKFVVLFAYRINSNKMSNFSCVFSLLEIICFTHFALSPKVNSKRKKMFFFNETNPV